MEISASAFNSGINTIQSGQRRIDQAALDIASNTLAPAQPGATPPVNQVNPAPSLAEQTRPDLAESLVALREGQNEAQAGTKVVKTADEVLGTLIDTTA